MPDDVVYHLDQTNKVHVVEGDRVWRVTAGLRWMRRKYKGAVLQHLYVADDGETEWRDVPCVGENG